MAFRLTRAMGRHEGHRSFEHRAIARIMKLCFSILSRRLLDFGFKPPNYRQLAIGPPGQTAAQRAENYAAHAAFLSQAQKDF